MFSVFEHQIVGREMGFLAYEAGNAENTEFYVDVVSDLPGMRCGKSVICIDFRKVDRETFTVSGMTGCLSC